jgi:hypothetical protein
MANLRSAICNSERSEDWESRGAKEVAEALSNRNGECAIVISRKLDRVKETPRTTLFGVEPPTIFETTRFRGEGTNGAQSKEYTRELMCVYPKALVWRRDLPAV